MINKLLVAYDGSGAVRAAFDFARDLAGKYSAELFVLAVSRPPEFGGRMETEVLTEQSIRHHQLILNELQAEAGNIGARFEVKAGHPAEAIVLRAEDHGIDHIVIGHRGHGPLERWLLGSVARQVIAHAHCAATVVRPHG